MAEWSTASGSHSMSTSGGQASGENPFVIGKDGTRDEVIKKYEAWLLAQPALLAALPELRGKTLGCWCAPQACHGDVLARLAEAQER